MKPCSFLCVITNIGISISLLALKAAFTKLAYIRVHEFLCFFALVKFQLLFEKNQKFHIQNIYYSGRRLM